MLAREISAAIFTVLFYDWSYQRAQNRRKCGTPAAGWL